MVTTKLSLTQKRNGQNNHVLQHSYYYKNVSLLLFLLMMYFSTVQGPIFNFIKVSNTFCDRSVVYIEQFSIKTEPLYGHFLFLSFKLIYAMIFVYNLGMTEQSKDLAERNFLMMLKDVEGWVNRCYHSVAIELWN